MPKKSGKTLFEYDNYREYLQDIYVHLKASDKKFSFRYFSRVAGFQSPNFLKLVILGQRNLSALSIEKFATALKLNKEESAFFRNLVLLNQASTGEEKQAHAEQLLRSRGYKKIYPLKKSEFHYYTHWYFIPVRELVTLKGFKEDAEWIARQITPAISAVEAKKAIEELLRIGLLVRDEDGILRQTHLNVATADEVSAASVGQYHREMIKKGAESIDRFSRENREISAVTIGVSKSSAEQIKSMIQKFRKEILEVVSREGEPDRIYQLNFQLFPLAQVKGPKEQPKK